MRLKTIMLLLSLSFFVMPLFGQESTPEILAFAQPANALEGVNIYFTEANGEASRFDQLDPGISRLGALLQWQGASLHTLEWRTRFPDDIDLIIVVGPTTNFSSDQTARLWSYVSGGGRLLLLINPVVENAQTWALNSSFFSLLWNDFSLRGRDDVAVTDAPFGDETQASGQWFARFATTGVNTQHPVTAGLTEPLEFFVARTLQFDASPRSYSLTGLVTTGSNFYGETQYTGMIEYNIGADTPLGAQSLAVALEDQRVGMRLVLVGDREFVTNGAGFTTSPPGSASFLHPGNVRFVMNAIAWLTEAETAQYTFPTPGASPTPSLTPSPTPTFTPTPEAGVTPTPGS